MNFVKVELFFKIKYSFHSNCSINNKFDGRCLWQMDKIKEDDYYVWNFYFKEYLYAAYILNPMKQTRRNVFLWRGKPDTKQFVWNFECRNNI